MILKSLVSENVIVWTEFTSVSSTDMFDCVKYSEIQELREYIQIQLPQKSCQGKIHPSYKKKQILPNQPKKYSWFFFIENVSIF